MASRLASRGLLHGKTWRTPWRDMAIGTVRSWTTAKPSRSSSAGGRGPFAASSSAAPTAARPSRSRPRTTRTEGRSRRPSTSPAPISSHSSRGWRPAGGVERWTRAAEEDPRLAVSLERANDEQRRLRPELPVGIGGSSRTGSLKCLHAHGAFALARPGYELGERILAEAEPLFPSGGCCMDR